MSSIEWPASTHIAELPPDDTINAQSYLSFIATDQQRESFMAFHSELCGHASPDTIQTALGAKALNFPQRHVAGTIGLNLITVRQNRQHMTEPSAFMVVRFDIEKSTTTEYAVTDTGRVISGMTNEWDLSLENGAILHLHQRPSPVEKVEPKLEYAPELYFKDVTLLPSTVLHLIKKHRNQ